MPSFEMFKKAVYKSYIGSMKIHGEEAEKYFHSEEAETEMRNQYESLMKQLKAGKIDERVVLGTGAGGVAYCLVMMF